MALAAVSGAAASSASGVQAALLQEGVVTTPTQLLDLAGAHMLGLGRSSSRFCVASSRRPGRQVESCLHHLMIDKGQQIPQPT